MRHAEALFSDGDRKMYDLFQFSPAVKAGPFIFISGVIGADARGWALPSAEEEFHAAFRTISALLE